jgi:putative NADH-flavin reductase
MQNNIKIAVIGGTGKSGRYLVQRLLSQAFPLKILVRNPETLQIKSPLIEIIQGDARNIDAVRSLIKGCQAVISTLGQPKGEGPVFSQATANVIRSMNDCGIKRYILITGLNVDTALDKKNAKTAFATEWMKNNYPQTTADKQRELELLSESNIDWTLVRLPLIELTDKKSEWKASLEDCPGEKISATDLADFLIGQLFEKTYIRKAPFIANVK